MFHGHYNIMGGNNDVVK